MSFVNYMEITTLTLVQYCEQIASGMKYLASKGVNENTSKFICHPRITPGNV